MADTIDALLRDAARRHGTKDAVVEPRERLTYRELDIQTLELAAAFLDAGINKGCRASVWWKMNVCQGCDCVDKHGKAQVGL